MLARTRFDDGGFSGGNMERPALQGLLADIRAGRIDIVNRLQGRPADAIARRFCPAGRDL
jgi:DNA invertase Pin-like site-specific DNA recombinase